MEAKKNKWVMILLAIIIALAGALNVYAEDAEVDEKHETYYIHYVTTRQFDTYKSEWNVGASFTFKEGYVPAFYWYETDSDYRLQLMFYNENSGDIIDTETCEMYKYESKYSTYCSYNPSGIKTYSNGLVEPIEIVAVNYMLCGWDGPMYMESSDRKKTVATNIPIFIDASTASAYLNNDGAVTVRDALNYEDVIEFTYDSDEVPIPKNVKVSEVNEKYYLTWEQDVDDLDHISKVWVTKRITGQEYEREEGKAYPSYPHMAAETYEPSLSFKVDITDVILNMHSFYREDVGVDKYKVGLDIEIKNSWEKKFVETYFSTEVHALLTISYSLSEGIKVSVEYEEKDHDGNYVPDSDYNDYGDGSGIVDDNFTVVGGSTNFLDYIINGFGIISEGGLLDMLAGTFSFIPTPLWSILGAGLSVIVLVVVFKMVVK